MFAEILPVREQEPTRERDEMFANGTFMLTNGQRSRMGRNTYYHAINITLTSQDFELVLDETTGLLLALSSATILFHLAALPIGIV